MFSNLFTKSVKPLPRPVEVDAMNVAGKNAQMHEDLLAGGDDSLHIENIVDNLRKAGCAESTLELMRKPQPFPKAANNP